MIDPVTGKEILPGAESVVRDVKRSADERLAALEEKLERLHRMVATLAGHSVASLG